MLWIAGPGASARLVTVGPIRIAEIVSHAEAIRRLPYEPWSAEFHALAESAAAESPREVVLDELFSEMRFVSTSRPRLDPGKNLGQQLQTMRELTSNSARAIETLWRDAVATDGQEFDSLLAELVSLGDLDTRREVLCRREQSFLRRSLLLGDTAGYCALCGDEFPADLLVTAHIKPRSQCSDAEKRDYLGNVVLMCRLGCDVLFELGFISVLGGIIQVSAFGHPSHGVRSHLSRVDGRRSAAWSSRREVYFTWHARHVFR